MASALEAFQAQREAAEQLQRRVSEIGTQLRDLHAQVDRLAKHPNLLALLQEEANWLARAERVIAETRAFRERETTAFWPAVARRWTLAIGFALACLFAGSAGYEWASRPYDVELTDLRARVASLDAIAERVLTMTPAERRRFEELMKPSASTHH
jgi:hypothetical protein